jgi:type VI secretion system secreted protein Hcp
MRVLCVAAAVVLMSAGAAAQGNSGKGNNNNNSNSSSNNKPRSAITMTLGTLQCTTPAGADAFGVLSWSWGASNPTTIGSGGGGAGAGKASLSDLNILKSFDACSPALFGGVVTGKAFPTATLTQSNSDGTVTTLTLTDVFVTAWQASGSNASEAPTESVSFAFAKVCLADGASGGRFCFDVAANRTF